MTNNPIISLVREMELSSGWFASQQNDGTLVLHNFPTDIADEEADAVELVELHLSPEDQAPLLRLLKSSWQGASHQDALPRIIASKRLHGDVWLLLDEAGQLTFKDADTVLVLSNIAARGLLNFCHKQGVQDVIRLTTDSTIA